MTTNGDELDCCEPVTACTLTYDSKLPLTFPVLSLSAQDLYDNVQAMNRKAGANRRIRRARFGSARFRSHLESHNARLAMFAACAVLATRGTVIKRKEFSDDKR